MRKYYWGFIFLLLSLTPEGIGQGLFEQAQQTDTNIESNGYNLNGFVRSAMYAGADDDVEEKIYLQSLYSQFGLSAGVKAGTYGAAYAEFRTRTGFEFDQRFSSFELREGYADLYTGPFDIRAGKQVLSWGKSSFINPSDQFSPQDLTFRSPDMDDLRMGTWALRTNLLINSSSTLQAIWIPVYQPSVLMIEPFSFPEYIDINAYEDRSAYLSESSFGFRYDLRSSLLDVQFSYFNGYRNTPAIAIDSLHFNFSTFEPEKLFLDQVPYRIHSAGLNITVPVGSYLFRTETAWMKAFSNENVAFTPFPELSYTFEIEQSGSNVTVIAGYYGKYIIDFEKSEGNVSLITNDFTGIADKVPPGAVPEPDVIEDILSGQINSFNRLYTYQEEEFYHAVYASASVSMFHDLVDLEIPGMYNFTSEEFSFMPSLKFNITDGLALRTGAYFLSGKNSSLFDMIGPALNAGYVLLDIKF
ncbi:MAG: DUF1302 family protein [Bacteroidales bacterium]